MEIYSYLYSGMSQSWEIKPFKYYFKNNNNNKKKDNLSN